MNTSVCHHEHGNGRGWASELFDACEICQAVSTLHQYVPTDLQLHFISTISGYLFSHLFLFMFASHMILCSVDLNAFGDDNGHILNKLSMPS